MRYIFPEISMLTTLLVCLCIGTNVHAGSTSSAPSNSTLTTAAPLDSTRVVASDCESSLFDMDAELKKIATTCLTNRDHELLSGDILRHSLARLVNAQLVEEAYQVIGLEELRNVLGFAPLRHWTNYREPREDEIAAAPTIEAYYELREPRTDKRSLDSDFFYEKNFPPAIAFLDKRIPAVRTIYRHKFKEIRCRPNANVAIDRKEVDRMIDEYITIFTRMYNASFSWIHTRCL